MDKEQQNTTVATPLTLPQEKVFEALIAGATVTDAARQAGVDRSTVYRWLHESTFYLSFNQAKEERTESVRAELRSLGKDAVETLRGLLKEAVPPAVRFKAACRSWEPFELWKSKRLALPTANS
jgi:transposase-like protein